MPLESMTILLEEIWTADRKNQFDRQQPSLPAGPCARMPPLSPEKRATERNLPSPTARREQPHNWQGFMRELRWSAISW